MVIHKYLQYNWKQTNKIFKVAICYHHYVIMYHVLDWPVTACTTGVVWIIIAETCQPIQHQRDIYVHRYIKLLLLGTCFFCFQNLFKSLRKPWSNNSGVNFFYSSLVVSYLLLYVSRTLWPIWLKFVLENSVEQLQLCLV